MFLFKRTPPSSLIDIDNLYQDVISKLPISNRIKYCESLIYRTTEDISTCNCRLQKRTLKKLLNASKFELKKLSSA